MTSKQATSRLPSIDSIQLHVRACVRTYVCLYVRSMSGFINWLGKWEQRAVTKVSFYAKLNVVQHGLPSTFRAFLYENFSSQRQVTVAEYNGESELFFLLLVQINRFKIIYTIDFAK